MHIASKMPPTGIMPSDDKGISAVHNDWLAKPWGQQSWWSRHTAGVHHLRKQPGAYGPPKLSGISAGFFL